MRTYTPELKAQVIAEWKAGSARKGLARAHKIPQSTVHTWLKGHTRVALVSAPDPKKKVAELYDLDAMALKLIDGSVSAVTAIHGVTLDGAWLQRQNAADLAILLGVISDKLYRLLGAIKPAASHADADPIPNKPSPPLPP